jgi:hypothetical protein
MEFLKYYWIKCEWNYSIREIDEKNKENACWEMGHFRIVPPQERGIGLALKSPIYSSRIAALNKKPAPDCRGRAWYSFTAKSLNLFHKDEFLHRRK